MTTDVVAEITNQSPDELTAIVRRILGEDATPVGDLSTKPIGRSVGAGTAGIIHVSGRAGTNAGQTAWTAVVKALGQSDNVNPNANYDPLQEVDVYRAGVFANLCGGMRAPHCYGIQEREALVLLWLEDCSHALQPPWDDDQFLEMARNLGRFNAYWPEDALPQWNWLSQQGFRAAFTGSPQFQTVFERLPAGCDQPLMRAYLSETAIDSLMQLWQDCDNLLTLAETTARGICHRDCHPKNLFPMKGADGDSFAVGIDWVKVGVDNLGVDIGHLLSSPMIWLELTPEEAEALSGPVLDAYLAGLAEAGWSGNADGVKLTFLTRLACGAIRTTNAVSLVATMPGFSEQTERLLRLPMAEIIDGWGSMVGFCIARRNEAMAVAERMR